MSIELNGKTTSEAVSTLRYLLRPAPVKRLHLFELGAHPKRNGRFVYIPALVDPFDMQLYYCALDIAILIPDLRPTVKGDDSRLIEFSWLYRAPALEVWHTVNEHMIVARLSTILTESDHVYTIRPSVHQDFRIK